MGVSKHQKKSTLFTAVLCFSLVLATGLLGEPVSAKGKAPVKPHFNKAAKGVKPSSAKKPFNRSASKGRLSSGFNRAAGNKKPAVKQPFNRAVNKGNVKPGKPPKTKGQPPKKPGIAANKKPKGQGTHRHLRSYSAPPGGLRNRFNTASGARITDKFNQAAKGNGSPPPPPPPPAARLMPPTPRF